MKIIKPEIIYVLIIAVILTAVVSDWYFFDSVASMICGPCGCRDEDCGGGPCVPVTCEQLGRTCGTMPDTCGGTLNCGTCPSGKVCSSGRCMCSCMDGTLCSTCSRALFFKPKYCDASGNLIYSTCGPPYNCPCPVGTQCISNGNCAPCRCSDGTWCGACSIVNKGKMCRDGNLIEDCEQCYPCPTGMECKLDKTCCMPKTCSDLEKYCGSWDDGCGFPLNCGTCPSPNWYCTNPTDITKASWCGCIPKDCDSFTPAKECGAWSDGCGGYVLCGNRITGACPTGYKCNHTGQCITPCIPSCSGRVCGSDGCGPNNNCGTCPAGQTCNETSGQCCIPNCVGKECGDDGCGGICGTCTTSPKLTCDSTGKCVCIPSTTCKSLGYDCGTYTNNCGTVKDCGPCTSQCLNPDPATMTSVCKTCTSNKCVAQTCTATWSGSIPNDCEAPWCSAGSLHQTRNCNCQSTGGCTLDMKCTATTSCQRPNSCTDSDYGNYPLVAGTVTGWQDYPSSTKYEWKDQCLVGNKLLNEWYCSGTQAVSEVIQNCVSCPTGGPLPQKCTALT